MAEAANTAIHQQHCGGVRFLVNAGSAGKLNRQDIAVEPPIAG